MVTKELSSAVFRPETYLRDVNICYYFTKDYSYAYFDSLFEIDCFIKHLVKANYKTYTHAYNVPGGVHFKALWWL
jgi:hypothetical protein